MSDGMIEARVAARWWADRLAEGEMGSVGGDGTSDALASFVRLKTLQPTPEQIDAFRAHLERALFKVATKDHWTEAVVRCMPRWGSALRSFGVDYGPDPILADALEAAGLNPKKLLLPLKTVMWFNPGAVTVSLGYNAPEKPLSLAD